MFKTFSFSLEIHSFSEADGFRKALSHSPPLPGPFPETTRRNGALADNLLRHGRHFDRLMKFFLIRVIYWTGILTFVLGWFVHIPITCQMDCNLRPAASWWAMSRHKSLGTIHLSRGNKSTDITLRYWQAINGYHDPAMAYLSPRSLFLARVLNFNALAGPDYVFSLHFGVVFAIGWSCIGNHKFWFTYLMRPHPKKSLHPLPPYTARRPWTEIFTRIMRW